MLPLETENPSLRVEYLSCFNCYNEKAIIKMEFQQLQLLLF